MEGLHHQFNNLRFDPNRPPPRPPHDPTPWMRTIPSNDSATTPLELLNCELKAFTKHIQATEEEVKARRAACVAFTTLINEEWPRAKVYVQGSSSTGLHLPDGDIDITMLGPNRDLPSLPRLRDFLPARGFTSRVEWVRRARVPIVRFLSAQQYGSYKFDVSLNRENGIHVVGAMQLALTELGEDHAGRVKPLLLWLKLFLKRRGLDQVRDGGLGGLSCFCLVVWFVQSHGADLDRVPTQAEDLIAFLRYYTTEFDYVYDSITILDGGSLLDKEERGWLKEDVPGQAARLSIQHPVELERDTAAGGYAIATIKSAFRNAYDILIKFTPESRQAYTVGYVRSVRRSVLEAVQVYVTAQEVDQRERNLQRGEVDQRERNLLGARLWRELQ